MSSGEKQWNEMGFKVYVKYRSIQCIAYGVNDSPSTHLFSTVQVDFELHEITCAQVVYL